MATEGRFAAMEALMVAMGKRIEVLEAAEVERTNKKLIVWRFNKETKENEPHKLFKCKCAKCNRDLHYLEKGTHDYLHRDEKGLIHNVRSCGCTDCEEKRKAHKTEKRADSVVKA